MALAQSNPPHFRRNVAGLLVDAGSYGAGTSFIHPPTVIPALAQHLTTSQSLVGLMMTVWNGAWLLPQLWAGQWLSGKPRKKPYLLAFAAIGRPALLLMALTLALGNRLAPEMVLAALFATCAIFRSTDAVAAVAWFDVLSGAVPPAKRGRVLGAMQMLIGLFGLGAAFFLRWWLGPQGPAFSYNYAVLFGLAFIGVIFSFVGLIALVELPGDPATDTARLGLVEHVKHVISRDHAFRMVTVVRMLSGLAGLAWPFYVSHATRVLGLPDSTIGLFVAVQSITGVLISIGMGWVSERYGSLRVIHVSTIAACVPPLLAIVLHLTAMPLALRTMGYLLVYSFLSIVDCSFLLGYLNYVMDIAPPDQRPAYMGLTNTLGGLLVVLPTLGGWLLQNTSYTTLFGVTLLGALAGLAASWRLPPSRA